MVFGLFVKLRFGTFSVFMIVCLGVTIVDRLWLWFFAVPWSLLVTLWYVYSSHVFSSCVPCRQVGVLLIPLWSKACQRSPKQLRTIADHILPEVCWLWVRARARNYTQYEATWEGMTPFASMVPEKVGAVPIPYKSQEKGSIGLAYPKIR